MDIVINTQSTNALSSECPRDRASQSLLFREKKKKKSKWGREKKKIYCMNSEARKAGTIAFSKMLSDIFWLNASFHGVIKQQISLSSIMFIRRHSVRAACVFPVFCFRVQVRTIC